MKNDDTKYILEFPIVTTLGAEELLHLLEENHLNYLSFLSSFHIVYEYPIVRPSGGYIVFLHGHASN